MTGFSDEMTLGEARDQLRELVKAGGHKCPCCTQWAQVYRWSLYATAAQALVLLLRLGADTKYVHTGELKTLGHRGQGDCSRLRHWGLAEQESERRPDGGRSGYWQLTPLGIRFARSEVTIQKYAYVYDGRVLRLDGPPVSIHDVLGKKFSYAEIMGATA